MSATTNPAAERFLVGLSLCYPREVLAQAGTAAEDLTSPALRAVLSAALAVAARGEPVGVVTVEAELTRRGDLRLAGGVSALGELCAAPAEAGQVPGHVPSLLALLREATSRRTLGAMGDRLRAVATTGEGTVEEAVQAALGRLRGLQDAGGGGRSAREVFGTIIQRWEDRRGGAGVRGGVATGIEALDAELEAGGLPRGVLTVMAGDTGQGKTSLLKQIAVYAALSGHRVDVVSLEDQAEKVATRMIAQLAELENRRLQGAWPRDCDWGTAVGTACQLADFGDRLHFWSARDGDVDRLAAKVLARHRAHGTDLVVWDYLQKTRGPRLGSPYEAMTYRVQAIDSLCQEMGDSAVVLCSQFKRKDPNVPPALGDLKGSGEIENEAKLVVFLWTHPRLLKRDDRRLLWILKQSDGPTNRRVVVRWQPEFVRFRSVSEAEAQEFRHKLSGELGQ